MFSEEVRKLLIQVISSWQVLAVTVVLVIYISLVNRAAKMNQRRRPPPARKEKQKAQETVVSGTDDLGLVEKEPEK
jgi:hypothetical protein